MRVPFKTSLKYFEITYDMYIGLCDSEFCQAITDLISPSKSKSMTCIWPPIQFRQVVDNKTKLIQNKTLVF